MNHTTKEIEFGSSGG